MLWKLEVAVGEADGSIEISSDATHNPALATGPPGTKPAIDAAIPVAPAKKLCRLKFAVLPAAPASCRSLAIAGSARLSDSNSPARIVSTSPKCSITCWASYDLAEDLVDHRRPVAAEVAAVPRLAGGTRLARRRRSAAQL